MPPGTPTSRERRRQPTSRRPPALSIRPSEAVHDGFVAKLDPTGSALAYSTYLGGTGFDPVPASRWMPRGNAYATGSTSSTDFPTTAGAFQSGNATVAFSTPS